MIYVTVVFDPKRIAQILIDNFKPWLQTEVASVLSAFNSRLDQSSTEDITTKESEIFVTQQEVHPTDVNAPPFMINIQAGRSKGRDGNEIAQMLCNGITDTEWLPEACLGEGQSSVLVAFHENDGFAFTRTPKQRRY